MVLLSALSTSAQCTISFSGHIDASVVIKELNLLQKTGTDGLFSFKGLCPGFYTVKITHSGCIPFEFHFHLKTDFEKDFVLNHTAEELGEVVVTGYSSKTSPGNELKGKALEATRGLSLAESMKRISGVSVLQTGTTIYKPVIHGLHSNRVLILNNGVRQEAQQWGSEHAPEIDPFIANRISVIKGASALRYGGDAIGGVVLVEPKFLRNDPGIGGELNTSFFSNNRMGVASAMLEGKSEKWKSWSWRLQGTYKRGGNAKTPRYWLANSANEELNFSVSTAWQTAAKGLEIFYSQFNTRLGIFSGSHIGNVTDLWNAIQSKEPPDYIRNVGFSYAIERPYQQVQHQLLKIKARQQTGKTGRLTLTVSGQYNNRDEFDQKRFASSSDAPQLSLTIGTAITELVWDHFNTGKFKGTVGGSFLFQQNSYERRLFIPNYQSINYGFFAVEKFTTGKTELEAGIRFDRKSFFNISDNSGNTSFADLLFTNLSGNTGLTYKASPAVRFNFAASTAWRAPQPNELYANGLHHGAARIEKGNTELSAERSNNLSASVLINTSKWDIDAGIYIKEINDFIFLEPTFPPELTIRGAFPSFRYNQTNARLHGSDVTIQYTVNAHWLGTVKASVLRAWNKTAKDWLIQMPADRYETEVTYRFGNAKKINDTYISFSSTYVLRQKRVPGSGNIEVPGTGTKQSDYLAPPPAYFLLALEAGTQLKMKHENWGLILSITNLGNLAYRDYMNAFRYFSDEMGRNISLRLKIPFNIKHQHN
jgi:iron complex outermembrane recepter protein